AYWRDAVLVSKGGVPAIRAALDARRTRGQRGPQRRPTKVSVTVRYSPEVVAWFKSTGEGWQRRMDAVLRDYVARQQ
ncbi:MAG: BrnA antitoxin family protein, partial [Lamprocystis purpurea]|nr:BrnA antitoxin family protein [Lamprocystis purpurea]